MKYGLILLLICQQAFSQTVDGFKTQPERPGNQDVSGNPYLLNAWNDGVIKFTSGRIVKQFKLKFDCLNNQLLLQFEGNTFAAESKVNEFVIYPKGKFKGDSMVFRKGFPAVDRGNEQTYYQVLLDGKNILLRLFVKLIIEEKQLVGGTSFKKTEDDEQYYLLQDKAMILLPKEKNAVHESFPLNQNELRQYIAKEQLKMRSAMDFVKLVQYYNTL
jgi:hypothetical protein